MAEGHLAENIQQLHDLELALLSCLIADQHCIIRTAAAAVDTLGEELGKISIKVFGLSPTIINCSENTDLDDFREGLFVNTRYSSLEAAGQSGRGPPSDLDHASPRATNVGEIGQDGPRLANIVIAKGLNCASDEVQIQALELVRSRRVFVRGSFYAAPKQFVLVILPAGDDAGPRSNAHLIGHILLSHHHPAGERSPGHDRTGSDTPSVVRKRPPTDAAPDPPVVSISAEDIDMLARQSQTATLGMDVRRYLYDVVVFLRMHRAVESGVSAKATKHFELLARCLAALHGLSYVTPSLVALAAKKVYPHRIIITAPQNERSMQWGSDLAAVTVALQSVTPESVINEVLGTVDVPV